MSRRLLLLLIVPILGLVIHVVWAGQKARVSVVGLLVPSIPRNHPALETLRKRLHELGYVEGQNIRYEFRSAQGQLARLPGLAEELVRANVDVIVAATDSAIVAAKNATRTIPIVIVATSSDPTTSRLVQSFSRPGGNVTGIFTGDSELLGKRLELLKETLPALSRVAVMWDVSSDPRKREELGQAAHSLKLQLELVEIRAPLDTDAGFRAARKKQAEAVMILLSPALYVRSAVIAQEALANRLPLMGFAHDFTRAGGLLTYGTDLRDT